MQSGGRNKLATRVLLLALSASFLGAPLAPAALADQAKPGLDTSAPKSIATGDDLERWMDFYYLHPQPELLTQAMHFADSSGMVKQGEAPLMAFTSRVFAQNPKKIPQWVSELGDLSPAARTTFWSALWWSNTIEGKESLNRLATSLPSERDKDAVLGQMAKPAQPIEQMELNRPEVIDELWGAFTATGDEKYVNRLISTIPWLTDNGGDYIRLTIAGAAKWSLISNAQIHPKVMACLMKARQDQPNVRKTIDQMIAEAQKAPQSNNQQAATHSPQ